MRRARPPGLLLPSVVSTIGLTEPAGRELLPTLIDHLANKQLMLVLDDCDPVLSAGAELAEAVLRSCSRVRMLVTSREALGVAGESIMPVASLATPDAGSVTGARRPSARSTPAGSSSNVPGPSSRRST